MIKKMFISMGIVLLLSFSSCGSGDSSEEAKELLQKILNLVGIPQEIMVNICQDNNTNGICESTEPQVSVAVNRGDNFNTIWQKISKTEGGQYLLETIDPTKPILLVLQDETKVNGKFAIPFNGFTNYEQNETKELSILASMVDKEYFTDGDLEAIRNLENSNTQATFYAKLLDALETNVNTLNGVGLDAQNGMLANLEEMSKELNNNGIKDTLARELNSCGADSNCVDVKLETLYTDIIISNERANTLKNNYSQPTTPTPIASNGEKVLLLSKMVSTDEDGDVIDTVFEYNSKNQITKSKSYNNQFVCTYNYDNLDRYIGYSCPDMGEGDNISLNITYSGNSQKITHINYNNGEAGNVEILEWSGDNYSKIRQITVDKETGENMEIIMTASYSNNNPTHIEWSVKDNDSGEFLPVAIEDGIYDNKKKASNMSSNILFGFNSIVNSGGLNYMFNQTNNLVSSEFSLWFFSGSVRTEIQYNSSDMPTRIDKYTSSNLDTEEETKHSSVTYEYTEAK